MKKLILLLAFLTASSYVHAATLSINIPDDQVTRIENAFASEFGYPEQVRDGNGDLVSNPESKTAFAKQQVIKFIKDVVKSSERVSSRQSFESSFSDATIN